MLDFSTTKRTGKPLELRLISQSCYRMISVCSQVTVTANVWFFVKFTGSSQENPVLIALSAEFSKFTLLLLSHRL